MNRDEIIIFVSIILAFVALMIFFTFMDNKQEKELIEQEKEIIEYIKKYPQCANSANPAYCGELLDKAKEKE